MTKFTIEILMAEDMPIKGDKIRELQMEETCKAAMQVFRNAHEDKGVISGAIRIYADGELDYEYITV